MFFLLLSLLQVWYPNILKFCSQHIFVYHFVIIICQGIDFDGYVKYIIDFLCFPATIIYGASLQCLIFNNLIFSFQKSDIHCRVPIEYEQTFDSVLTVNSTQTISNFQVSLNDMLFKPSEYKFQLTFSGGTSVTDINKQDIPPKPLNFTPFADILTGK